MSSARSRAKSGRPSPSASATAHAVGARKRGNDGTIWVVAESRAGVRRWQRPKARAAPTSSHRILFCEPYTTDTRRRGVRLTVGDTFYPTLLRAPLAVRSRYGNAYRFGPRFPLSSYRRLGSHGNDGGQTGFIDLDLFDPKMFKGDRIGELVLDAFGLNSNSPGKYVPWGDRGALRKVRAAVPAILFIGETLGGDVGAALYAHSVAGHINGLTIDNNYYFPEGTLL